MNLEVYNKQKADLNKLLKEKQNLLNDLNLAETKIEGLKETVDKKTSYYEK